MAIRCPYFSASLLAPLICALLVECTGDAVEASTLPFQFSYWPLQRVQLIPGRPCKKQEKRKKKENAVIVRLPDVPRGVCALCLPMLHASLSLYFCSSTSRLRCRWKGCFRRRFEAFTFVDSALCCDEKLLPFGGIDSISALTGTAQHSISLFGEGRICAASMASL